MMPEDYIYERPTNVRDSYVDLNRSYIMSKRRSKRRPLLEPYETEHNHTVHTVDYSMYPQSRMPVSPKKMT